MTLVESGEAGSDTLVLDAIRRTGRTEQDLVPIVLTHWHHDHTEALRHSPSGPVPRSAPDAPTPRSSAASKPAFPRSSRPPKIPSWLASPGTSPGPACPVHR
ncbi:MBL fold metallo-hydrolase [Streptomyces coeruleorubidus]|uniref:MBL fold metallo-hydrolase n=1 Tax=Streptomyces coeruleorubidus TaxID=116188 RepID=A0A5J6HWK8_STRC4|nr:MBL fold metallo-hydrolase [Streptomyces coeruleorubidus]